jgi:hypothetical protein
MLLCASVPPKKFPSPLFSQKLEILAVEGMIIAFIDNPAGFEGSLSRQILQV